MIGLKESFWLMYSNTHLKSRETLPLKTWIVHILFDCCSTKSWELTRQFTSWIKSLCSPFAISWFQLTLLPKFLSRYQINYRWISFWTDRSLLKRTNTKLHHQLLWLDPNPDPHCSYGSERGESIRIRIHFAITDPGEMQINTYPDPEGCSEHLDNLQYYQLLVFTSFCPLF